MKDHFGIKENQKMNDIYKIKRLLENLDIDEVNVDPEDVSELVNILQYDITDVLLNMMKRIQDLEDKLGDKSE